MSVSEGVAGHVLYLHDTLTAEKRSFEPAGNPVKLYVCGVTPYDTTHLGHAFTFVAFDVLVRYLRYLGYQVRYVQNVTDVDEPLFEKARQIGEPPGELAAEQTRRYFEDMQGLNVLPADVFPRASGEIPEMIELVEQLLHTGHAYIVDGHVYFSVETDRSYGELSKLSQEEMIELARERGGNPDDPLRRNPLDFVLWRPPEPGEPSLASPWGEGLPGWHLECSAMSLKYLGEPIDIHGGGVDLVFPHHESEIAQSEGATGFRPFVRYWVHTGMVYLGPEKMSKSLGNMVFVRDLLQTYSANAIRLYLLSHHYRAEVHFDQSDLDRAAELARELEEAALPAPVRAGSRRAPGSPMPLEAETAGEGIKLAPYRERFLAQMGNDLNTPGAIDVLRELAGAIRTAQASGQDVDATQQLLRELGGVLGLRLDGAEAAERA